MFGCVHFSFSVKGKEIALTFDDGPHPEYTTQILEVLKNQEVKATFFVNGSKIEQSRDLIFKMLADGHQVANHSSYHRNFLLRSTRSMCEDILKTDKLLRKCGVKGDIPFRPPYGRFDLGTLLIMKKLEKQLILWNAASKDYKAKSSNQILFRLRRKVKPGCIIVMHDAGKSATGEVYRDHTVKALMELLPELKSQGYKFFTINEMLNL